MCGVVFISYDFCDVSVVAVGGLGVLDTDLITTRERAIDFPLSVS